ncbi:glycolipid transfer protein-like isoform X2 [Branchiostoma lanceolatum]|uniref:glycolipid transfer protein-like isoform X2 n=1 Tax=Branchiostoma lanceolatum TaxID=7740 RepID=UPI0034520BE5
MWAPRATLVIWVFGLFKMATVSALFVVLLAVFGATEAGLSVRGEQETREQWADDMAVSSDDSALQAEDELALLNNKLSELRQLVLKGVFLPEIRGEPARTELGKFFSGFADVQLTVNGDIPTKPFLDACDRMVPFLDVLGPTAFAPVKSDIKGNIKKLTQKYSTDPARYSTLQAMVKQEMATKDKNSATDALLWLNRALQFIRQILVGIATGEKDLTKVAKKAYEDSLKKYHGWMVQGIFSLAMKAVPYYNDFVTKVALGDEKALIQDAKTYGDAMGVLAEILQTFYMANDLDSKQKV